MTPSKNSTSTPERSPDERSSTLDTTDALPSLGTEPPEKDQAAGIPPTCGTPTTPTCPLQ